MSIEALIAANTEALQRLTAVLQSQQITPAATDTSGAAPGTDKPGRTPRKAKDTPPAADTKETPAAGTTTGSPASTPTTVRASIALGAANAGTTPSLALQAGDPEGTLYFHVEGHRTVAAVKPGEVVPNMAGMVEIDGAGYAALKAQYAAALVPTEGNANAATSSAVPATSGAATASSGAAQQSPSATPIDATSLTEKFKRLHARDGNDALAAVLAKFAAKRVGELVAQTAKHAEIDKHLEALLNPPAAGADLF